MQTINTTLAGRHVVDGDLRFQGLLNGDMVVPAGAVLELDGMVTGDVTVSEGGSAIIRGTVNGTVWNRGGSIQIYGSVGSVAGNPGTIVHDGAMIHR